MHLSCPARFYNGALSKFHIQYSAPSLNYIPPGDASHNFPVDRFIIAGKQVELSFKLYKVSYMV